jgi:response regulator RpfG family c-di-GMP phosphodiesterase
MTIAFDPSQFSVLCVDDEANILSALRRMLTLEGFQVVTAESGALALEFMEKDTFHVLLTDLQMPGMSGVQLLEKVRQKWPDTMRLLLTGNADVHSAVAAINEGEIYRYLTKPWIDAELVGVIKSAIELGQLTKARQARLRASYVSSIKAFSGLMDLRMPSLLAHSRRVADLSKKLAQQAGLDLVAQQEVFIAGLLHDVGKIGLSDRILNIKFFELPLSEVKLYKKHCIMGQMSLTISQELEAVGAIVRSHHEFFDGTGFPDKLYGDNIPLGARIVGLVESYEELLGGEYTKAPSTPSQALRFVASKRGKLYCPVMVDHFLTMMGA